MSIFRSVVTIACTNLGGTGTNTWHFRTTTGGTSGERRAQLDIAVQNLEDYYTALTSIYTGNTTLRHDGEWTEVGTEDAELITSDTMTVAIGDVGNGMPPADCIVSSWRTSRSGRSGRGRTFLGPLRQTVCEGDGTPTAAARTTVQGAGDAFIGDFSGAGDGAFVVWSPSLNLGFDITSVTTRNVFASLRSRRD